MQLIIRQSHWDVMRAHVESLAPLEACGLLAGKNDSVEKVFLIENQAQSLVKFRMNPTEQLRAFNSMEADEMDLLAIFHSHPAGPEAVSATDIEEAAYPVVNIVWSHSRGLWKARGFWIEKGKVTEVNLLNSEKE